jgi:hopanoid biosynthesis associated protein HpnK
MTAELQKRLIVNADDFGLSSSVNSAVIKAWKEGVLTSASLMVTGAAFEEAVAFSKENPALQVGLHLTLVQGLSVCQHHGIPRLTHGDGTFNDDPVAAGMRYFFLKRLRPQLKAEIEGQILKFKETGLPLSHIDGHLNMHLHPVVFEILLPLMRKHDISSIRLSRERLLPELKRSRSRLFGKVADAFIFTILSQRALAWLGRFGISHTDEIMGLLNSGAMTEEYFLSAIDSLVPGLTEVYFHPGMEPCQEMQLRMPDYHHEEELAALLSQRIRDKLAALGVRLVNYRGEEKPYV